MVFQTNTIQKKINKKTCTLFGTYHFHCPAPLRWCAAHHPHCVKLCLWHWT